MKSVSLRQPLMLSGLVFMLLLSFLVVALSSYALLNASKRAYRRASLAMVRTLAFDSSPELLSSVLESRGQQESNLAIISEKSKHPEVSLTTAREALEVDALDLPWAAARMVHAQEETYLVGRVDRSIPSSVAFAEVSRMIPLILLAALAGAGIISLLGARVLLPSLESLAEVARETRSHPAIDEGLVPSDAPNEIIEVAQRFRRTVRSLNAERDRVEAQKVELQKIQEQLVRASKLASVGRLAAGVAHEIGNPLAAIQGYLSLLRLGLPKDQEQDVLDRSVKELGRIHQTIKQLLTYARQGAESPSVIETFSTLEVIDEAISLAKGHPALHGIELSMLDASDSLTAIDALGAPAQLKQVLLNLILNAAQSMSTHSPKNTPPRIVVRRRIESNAIELEVEDNGPGIPAEKQDAIFDPFFTTKAPGEGSGLGLAVSRSLMEAMQGDLFLRSEIREGACFVIRLRRIEEGAHEVS